MAVEQVWRASDGFIGSKAEAEAREREIEATKKFEFQGITFPIKVGRHNGVFTLKDGDDFCLTSIEANRLATLVNILPKLWAYRDSREEDNGRRQQPWRDATPNMPVLWRIRQLFEAMEDFERNN